MGYPKSINNLICSFKKLPGIGEKSAERMALSILEMEMEDVEFFSHSLMSTKTNVKNCKKCGNLSETEFCDICLDKNRENEILCVVEEPKNIITLEKVGVFNGRYHVLGGLISPLEDITPDDINIAGLIERIEENEIKEVILAIKPSIEGETTALYISKLLKEKNIIVSKIAYGIPIGADMEYLDSLTLEMALEDRKKISE